MQFRVYGVSPLDGVLNVKCDVLVLITDVDDNPPRWIFPMASNGSEVRVSAALPIGGEITVVKALDSDISSNLNFGILRLGCF